MSYYKTAIANHPARSLTRAFRNQTYYYFRPDAKIVKFHPNDMLIKWQGERGRQWEIGKGSDNLLKFAQFSLFLIMFRTLHFFPVLAQANHALQRLKQPRPATTGTIDAKNMILSIVWSGLLTEREKWKKQQHSNDGVEMFRITNYGIGSRFYNYGQALMHFNRLTFLLTEWKHFNLPKILRYFMWIILIV